MPTPTLANVSPFQKLHNQIPYYQFTKVFGCSCFPLLKPYNQHKLDFHTKKCVFIGYNPLHKDYKCLDKSGKVFIARHVTFNEYEFPYSELFLNQPHVVMSNSVDQTPSQVTFLQSCTLVDSNHEGSSTVTPASALFPISSSHSVSSSSSSATHFPSPPIILSHSMITRAKAGIFKPKTYLTVSQDLEPANVKAALQDSRWFSAMKEEI